jgi:hypothetical protein
LAWRVRWRSCGHADYVESAHQRGTSSHLFRRNPELRTKVAVSAYGRPIRVPEGRLAAADGASRRSIMNKAVIALMAATALPLAACASTQPNNTLASAGEGAAIGAAGGAGVAALTGGGVLTGAVIGAAVGGVAGAVWADRNNDGVADGYVQNGQYYAGAPAGYDASATSAARTSCPSVGHSAAVGAVGGAAVGAGVGALASGISIPGGALVGAAVGGLAGAVWADSNNDGCVDGYRENGQYYPGAPPAAPASGAGSYTGERG